MNVIDPMQVSPQPLACGDTLTNIDTFRRQSGIHALGIGVTAHWKCHNGSHVVLS
jgi:hypothetical protein